MRFESIVVRVLTLSLFVSGFAEARTTVDSKASFEYGILPQAVGTARKSEGWFGGQVGWKWNSEETDHFRFEAVINAELLGLSPSTSTASSQTLGSQNAKEWNKSGSPHYLEDQDFFFEYRLSRWRASLGARTLRWGVADFYDPLDQVNSRRLERPISSALSKRGEWMLATEWRVNQSGSLALEGFVIPIKRGAILPSQTSAWLPRQLYIPNLPQTEILLPSSLEYSYRDREERDAALRWNYGARILWRPGETEITLQYDEGASSFPAVRPRVSGPIVGISPEGRTVIQADPLIELTEVYYRERHYGASLVRPFGSWLTRVQFGKTEPMFSGRELAQDRGDVSIALEKQLGLGSLGQVTILAQGFKNVLEQPTGGTDIASFSKLFDRAAALGLRFAPRETASFMIGGLKSFSPKGGALILTSLSFDLTSSLAAEIAWTWIEADLDSPIGPFKDNDGGSIKLTAQF